MTLFYLIFLAAARASYAVAGCFKIALVALLGLLDPLAHQDHLLHNQLLPTNTHVHHVQVQPLSRDLHLSAM